MYERFIRLAAALAAFALLHAAEARGQAGIAPHADRVRLVAPPGAAVVAGLSAVEAGVWRSGLRLRVRAGWDVPRAPGAPPILARRVDGFRAASPLAQALPGAGGWERRTSARPRWTASLQLPTQDAAPEGGDGRWERRLAVAQGGYYLVTGLWPILHMRSFERVTGPKVDDWLVKTVGALIGVVGGTLLVSGLGDGPSDELKMVAAGSAAVLGVVDVTYVARGRIPRIYLLDAAAELALIAGWGATLVR